MYKPDSIHTIETGVFHITNIDIGRAVTTLLIESPPVESHPRILMDTAGEPLTNPKYEIPREDAIYAKRQLLGE